MAPLIEDLERELAALGPVIDADLERRRPGHQLPVAVLADIERRAGRRPATRRWLTVAAAAAVVVWVTLAVPAARNAVGRWLGFDSVRIVPTTGSELDLPEATFPVSLPPPAAEPTATAAAAETGLPVPSAPGLGEGVITVVRPPSSGQVVVVYPPSAALPATPIDGVGAILATLPGRITGGLFTKMAGSGVEVEAFQLVTADGRTVPAYWVGGEPHTLLFETDGGGIESAELRLASNTLLWQVGTVVYRLESALDRAAATTVAGSVVVAAEPP